MLRLLQRNPPRRTKWRRRTAAALALLLLALVGTWLLDHRRPRHDHFRERVGPISSVEEGAADLATPGFRNHTVRVQAVTGLEVQFRVLRPAELVGRIPLIVLLAGHRTGSRAVELLGDPGLVAVAALDYPYDGPEKIRGLRQGVKALPQIQQALLDTPPAVTLALDWLMTQPWVDPDRVELAGVSLGTPFAAVAGNLDTRFRRIWLMHGSADNRAWLEDALRLRVKNGPVRGITASAIHLLAHGASFDTATWVAGIAPRAVVVVGADGDESIAPADVRRLHDAAGEPKELLWTPGGHVTSRRPEIVRALLDIVRTRMREESPANAAW